MAVAELTTKMHSLTVVKAERVMTVKWTITRVIGYNSNYRNL
jgi:hypothetical protein